MMSLTFGLFTHVSGLGSLGPLVWFFGDFRCVVLLFIVILVIDKYRNR